MRAVDELEAGKLRVAARRHARHDAPPVFIREIHRAGHAPVDPAAARAIGEETLPPLIPGVAPRIAQALEEHLQPLGARVVGEDGAGVHPHHAVGRLQMAVDVDALVKVQPPIRPPAQCVDEMVRVLGAEAGEDDALRVGLAVAVGVGEVEQLGGLADVSGGGES